MHPVGFWPTGAIHLSKQGTRRGPYSEGVLAQLADPTSLKLYALFARVGEQETEMYEAAEARAGRVQRALDAPARRTAGAVLARAPWW